MGLNRLSRSFAFSVVVPDYLYLRPHNESHGLEHRFYVLANVVDLFNVPCEVGTRTNLPVSVPLHRVLLWFPRSQVQTEDAELCVTYSRHDHFELLLHLSHHSSTTTTAPHLQHCIFSTALLSEYFASRISKQPMFP